MLALAVVPLLLLSQQGPARRPEALFINPTYLNGGPRLISLAGAWAPLGEGMDGVQWNVASFSHRPLDADGIFGFEPQLSFGGALGAGRGDFDNDGALDRTAGNVNAQFGARLQIRRVGVGVQWRFAGTELCEVPDCTQKASWSESNFLVGAASGFLRDQLVVGAAVGLLAAGVDTSVQREGPFGPYFPSLGSAGAFGASYEAGLLLRPAEKRFRIGVSYRSASRGPFNIFNPRPPAVEVTRPAIAEDFFGRPVFAGFTAPHILSVGFAWKFGPGGEHFNALSPAAQRDYDGPNETLTAVPDEKDRGTLLLTTQVDFQSAVGGAVSGRAFFSGESEPLVANRAMVVPRVGVEHLTVPYRLRLRAGSYLESSIFQGVNPRPHATAGLDLRLFKLGWDWTVKAYVDGARDYLVWGVSVSTW